MTESTEIKDEPLTELTTDVVSAYVTNNTVPSSELPDLIINVHKALSSLVTQAQTSSNDSAPLTPAVPIKRSIREDYIICLEDGKQFKSLKRHLRAHYDLSPEEYRAKWGLASDYPMVAPAYAKKRSELAKKLGLGNSSRRK